MQVVCSSCKASDQSSKVQASQNPEIEFDTGLSARVTGRQWQLHHYPYSHSSSAAGQSQDQLREARSDLQVKVEYLVQFDLGFAVNTDLLPTIVFFFSTIFILPLLYSTKIVNFF